MTPAFFTLLSSGTVLSTLFGDTALPPPSPVAHANAGLLGLPATLARAGVVCTPVADPLGLPKDDDVLARRSEGLCCAGEAVLCCC
jgi:hypothetical protein